MSEQIRGIILEGQSCSGKTSIYNAIKKLHYLQPDTERNTIFLSEQYSQSLNWINGELKILNQEENIRVLFDRVLLLEQLNNYANSMGIHSRRSRGLFFVFERFHLNYSFSFDARTDSNYIEIEKRLTKLNAHTILCTISNDKVEQRLTHRAAFTNETITQAIINEYIKNQDLFVDIANNSKVPSTILNTDDMNWNSLAKTILVKV